MFNFFSRMETVNVALQERQLHIQSAREMIDTLRGDMKALREGFSEFWENTTAAADDLGLESPVLPRPRKIPRRLEDAVCAAAQLSDSVLTVPTTALRGYGHSISIPGLQI